MNQENSTNHHKVSFKLTSSSLEFDLEGEPEWVTDESNKYIRWFDEKSNQLTAEVIQLPKEESFEQLPLFAKAKSDTPPADQSKGVSPELVSDNGTHNGEVAPPDLCELYQKIARDNQREQILIISYFNLMHNKQQSCSTIDFETAYTEHLADIPVPYPSVGIGKLLSRNVEQGFMRKLSDGSYALTKRGRDAVGDWLNEQK